jgi:polysaccharide export outer membrane protein
MFFTSGFYQFLLYYLAQNDVVYVEPNKSKINGSAVGTNTGVIFFNFFVLL